MAILHKFVFVKSIQDNEFKYIKKSKASVILQNIKKQNYLEYSKIINRCKKLGIKIFISNDIYLLKKHNIKDFYISSFNKKFIRFKNLNIVGSAHNQKEINEKIKQGCKFIFISRLFQSDGKKGYLDIVKFNLLTKNLKNAIALGGINKNTIGKLKNVNCIGFAIKSDLRNKPDYFLQKKSR